MPVLLTLADNLKRTISQETRCYLVLPSPCRASDPPPVEGDRCGWFPILKPDISMRGAALAVSNAVGEGGRFFGIAAHVESPLLRSARGRGCLA